MLFQMIKELKLARMSVRQPGILKQLFIITCVLTYVNMLFQMIKVLNLARIDEANQIRMLEQALEEEKTKHAAICLELDKERAAAASAADEAMAMILRLQEDKASIEMEARQYQRMMEENFAYDDEEMNILKEILDRIIRYLKYTS
ncbi:hypothetical protein F3Y22_tig00110462pilonHSYRG00449 [Hibiscus syriacus]|uniref:GTD-binding domain-containing protein n=1 Tax=Hibiscus syriacus TaxID=106335 RepID=A0A6A3AL31_HIBSY|nr:hypothetical protein F3Y22_tig00110462pilonHSYRG00449 [Hibiscus syriacus]